MHPATHHVTLVLLLSIAALPACGDDPLTYSDRVGIELKAKSSDTTNGVVTDDKGITTESGNPYGAFVADSRRALGGADPSRIEVDGLELLLGARSTGVVALGEIFDGNVDVLFQFNDTNNTAVAGSVTIGASTGGGPVPMRASFDSRPLSAADYTKLLGGGFKVVIRGPAAPGFMAKGAEADLQLTFTFAAFE